VIKQSHLQRFGLRPPISLVAESALSDWQSTCRLAAVNLATALDGSGDVYFVPALAGLGAPHWDEKARGAIVGLSFGTRKEHLVRAALEAIAFQVKDVFNAMQRAVGAKVEALLADGGRAKMLG
jgi:glycerol kinase